MEIGTEAGRNSFSGNICFEFSVLYLCSAYLIGQREQTIATKTLKHIVTRLQNLSAPTPILMKPTLLRPDINETNTSPTPILMKPTLVYSVYCMFTDGAGDAGVGPGASRGR